MLKRITVVLVFMLAFIVVLEPRSNTAFSSVLTEAEIAVLNDTGAGATAEDQTKKDGNRFVKAVTFPFRAIGRLFGGGKKDDNKLYRLSKKDVKKFETTKVTRVIDARTAPVPTAAPTTEPVESDSPATLELNETIARQHFQRGRELFNANDINGAINSLSMAVSLDRNLWDAHNLLGIAYEMKGLRAKALESLETALKADRDQPEHLNDFGYILMRNGDYSRAVKYLKRAVKAQPNEQRFLNNLGLALVEVGKLDEAYKNFAKAMGEFDGRLNIATRLLRMGYDKEAIKHLEKCRALQPNSLDVLYRLSVLYARNGLTDEAEEANRTFLSLKATASATPQQ